MESRRHHRLKQLSLAFLRGAGCAAAAVEVRCPASHYRVDAGGHADPVPVRGRQIPGNLDSFSFRAPGRATTVLVECKQSRADYLRDTRQLADLLAERRRLDESRRHLEERLLRASEPHLLGSGSMLFGEMEDWDFASSRSPSYRAVLRGLRRIEKQIHGDTKFWTVARYALADVLLIAAPAGLIHARELSPGWGLLEFPDKWLEAPDDGLEAAELSVRLRRAPATSAAVHDRHRLRLLRNIAVAATARASPRWPRPTVQLADLAPPSVFSRAE